MFRVLKYPNNLRDCIVGVERSILYDFIRYMDKMDPDFVEKNSIFGRRSVTWKVDDSVYRLEETRNRFYVTGNGWELSNKKMIEIATNGIKKE